MVRTTLSRRCATLLLLVIACAGSIAGRAAAPTLDDPELVRLLDLIEHRARLMPDVARWKWQRQLPVTDPGREAAVLERGAAAAAAAGLEAASARALVAAQMAVARDIQNSLHARWQRRPELAGPEGPDLIRDLRPAITATTEAILAALPRVLPQLRPRQAAIEAALTARLTPLGAGPASIRALADALAALKPGPRAGDRIEAIRTRGVLRIGTTGDYAPFSAIDADGRRTGIDIELGRALAASLDVQVQFVATSWPTLMDDLQAQRFDIAMSGISRTLARARSAEFSSAYHVGGKTPIVRCADRGRFDSLAAIDRSDVRVIVNPGGTNERFARATLHHAQLQVFDDNTRIFGEIAAGRADAMFTDAIEVRLQTARDPRLCAALPGRTLTRQEKGLLLPRDPDGAWRRYVNLWLEQLRGDGTLAAIFSRQLEGTDPDRPAPPAHGAPARPRETPAASH